MQQLKRISKLRKIERAIDELDNDMLKSSTACISLSYDTLSLILERCIVQVCLNDAFQSRHCHCHCFALLASLKFYMFFIFPARSVHPQCAQFELLRSAGQYRIHFTRTTSKFAVRPVPMMVIWCTGRNGSNNIP